MQPTDPAPFQEPWHAQLFAITHLLAQQGHFSWPQWADRFSATLADAAASGQSIDEADYYTVWLKTLENLLGELEVADAHQLKSLFQQWQAAYRATPHGSPVIAPSVPSR